MRQEHSVGTSLYSLVRVALHQSQFLESFGHHPTDSKVNVHILNTGLCHLQDVVVTCFHNAVDFQLTLGELAVDRHRTGMITTVVVQFTTSITQYQTTILQFVCRWIAVHNLTMLREDGGETCLVGQ